MFLRGQGNSHILWLLSLHRALLVIVVYGVFVELSLNLLGVLCDLRCESKFKAQGYRASSGGVGQP